jgi:UDP-N-acetylmuramoylalanine--D-glutamate ligase
MGDLRSPKGTPGKARPPLPEGPFLILGLARSGSAAALALRARGLEVIGADTGEPPIAHLENAGVEVHSQSTGVDLLARARTLVKSPGIPSSAPAVIGARQRGLEVVGELELAWRLIANEFLAITGTNGKTTTTELIGHIHRVAGLSVAVAGNVGSAVASLAGAPGIDAPLDPGAVVVCECSSFQLEDTVAFSPEAAVLLNVSEDHLDRHGTLGGYVAAKLQAFARQGNDDVAAFPCDLGIEDLGGCARRVCFGTGPEAELADRAGQLWWDEQPLIAVEDLILRGAHNRLNAMAAAAVTLARGVEPDAVREGLRTFTGVPHRLEEVGRHRDVLYVNDSKATNVASTLVALVSFAPGTVRLILGGQGKDQDFTALREPIERAARHVLLIGEDAPRIGAALKGIAPAVTQCGDLERALAAASRGACGGDVVLLSPACASFDQFEDFEARGDRFRELVAALSG